MSTIATSAQAAKHYRVNIKTIRRWLQSGKIRGKQIGGRWHVLIEDTNGRIEDTNEHIGDNQNGSPTAQPSSNQENALLRKQLEEKESLIKGQDRLIDHLAQQIDHLTQVVGMSQKNIAALTERLGASQLMIEDLRKRKWWHIFRRG